jgi:hypothetical protein
MRKLFWGCLAGGVAVAGGMFGVAYHTCCHPDSKVGKCVLGASRAVAPVGMPSLGVRAASAPGSSEAAEEGARAPQAPVEIIPPAEEAIEPAPVAPMTGVVEPPATPITIHEDEVLTPLQVPAEVNSTIDKGDLPTADNHCPREMPYCQEKGKESGESAEDEAAEEDAEDEDAVQSDCPAKGEGEECEVSTLEKLFQMLKVEVPGWMFAPAEEAKPEEAPEPREDVHHHHSYPGCPYTGHCPGMSKPTCNPPAPPAKPEAGGEEPSEESQTSLHKAHKLKQRLAGDEVESSPEHPEIDTMEFRPSDANLYDYKLAGPL